MACSHPDTPAAEREPSTIVVAFELSRAKWLIGVCLPGSDKLSRYTIDAGDLGALTAVLAEARRKVAARCPGAVVAIASCYEAGYDGFWLHRWLREQGVHNEVVDPASIQVNRRARRAKTDRLDLEQLMRVLLAYRRGEPRVCSMVHVPSPEQEDAKRPVRERERLITERGAQTNRIKALLYGQGIGEVFPRRADFVDRLVGMRTADGRPLPPKLVTEIRRESACSTGRSPRLRRTAQPTRRTRLVRRRRALRSWSSWSGSARSARGFWCARCSTGPSTIAVRWAVTSA